MKKCERCGKRFDPEEEFDEFMRLCGMDYSCVTECICAECAAQAVDDSEEGVYIETCSECGCQYDPVEAEQTFRQRFPDSCNSVYSLVMCADCASNHEDDILTNGFTL